MFNWTVTIYILQWLSRDIWKCYLAMLHSACPSLYSQLFSNCTLHNKVRVGARRYSCRVAVVCACKSLPFDLLLFLSPDTMVDHSFLQIYERRCRLCLNDNAVDISCLKEKAQMLQFLSLSSGIPVSIIHLFTFIFNM